MKITQRPSLASANRRRVKPDAVRSKAPSRALKQSLRADLRSRRQSAPPSISTTKSEKSRDSILEAAAKLFGRQGFSATTLRQIASMAEIKAGSIYYYFDSKEAILDEVLDRGLLTSSKR